MFTISITGTCNKCKKSVSGKSKADIYNAMKKAGWQWKSAKDQFCPDHKSAKAEKKAGKNVKKAKVVAKPAKKASSKPSKETPKDHSEPATAEE